MDNSKPIVPIKDAMIIGNRLCGVPIDYPESHMAYPGCISNEKEVLTSQIINNDHELVETKRTIYQVINWK